MSYQIALSPAAQRDLKKLPPQVRQAAFDQHLSKIVAVPQTAGEPLHGKLHGDSAITEQRIKGEPGA